MHVWHAHPAWSRRFATGVAAAGYVWNDSATNARIPNATPLL